MTNRIEHKLDKMFKKFRTDCIIGTIGYFDRGTFRERKVIIVRNILASPYIFIGDAGISLLYIISDILYVRDLQDIAFNKEVF